MTSADYTVAGCRYCGIDRAYYGRLISRNSWQRLMNQKDHYEISNSFDKRYATQCGLPDLHIISLDRRLRKLISLSFRPESAPEYERTYQYVLRSDVHVGVAVKVVPTDSIT